MKESLVSVVIPTYNREESIAAAINSVTSQTYPKIELLVVDDNSSDNTEEVVTSIDDERIEYLKHDENNGAGAARNTGIEHAKGKYIAFLDSDDLWLPGKLEKQIKDLESSDENVKISYCGRYSRYAGSDVLVKTDMDVREGDIHNDLLKGWMDAQTSQLVIHRSCFEEVEVAFDPSFSSFQEYDLLVRLTENFEVTYSDQYLVEKEVGGSGIGSSYKNRIEGLERFLEKHKNRLEGAEGTSPDDFFESRITDIKGNKMVHKFSQGSYIGGLRAFREYYRSHDGTMRPLSLLSMAIVLDEGKIGKIANMEKAVRNLL